MGRGRGRKKASSKPNPYSMRGLNTFSQLTSELKARREEIASQIGASISDVRLTTVASSNDLVAVFPSSLVNMNVAHPPTSVQTSSVPSTPLDQSQKCNKNKEFPLSADPLPKVPKILQFWTPIVVLLSFIKRLFSLMIGRKLGGGEKDEFVHRPTKSLEFEPDHALHQSPSLFTSESHRFSLREAAEKDILHSVASPIEPRRHSYSMGKSSLSENLDKQLEETINVHKTAGSSGSSVQLPKESGTTNQKPRSMLSCLKCFPFISHGEAERKNKSSVDANPKSSTVISNSGNSKPPMMGMRARPRFVARQDKKYGAMFMLVIIMGGLIFGIVPGILATAIAWFMLPALRGFVKGKDDLGMNGVGATKRKEGTSSKVRKLDQTMSIRKERSLRK